MSELIRPFRALRHRARLPRPPRGVARSAVHVCSLGAARSPTSSSVAHLFVPRALLLAAVGHGELPTPPSSPRAVLAPNLARARTGFGLTLGFSRFLPPKSRSQRPIPPRHGPAAPVSGAFSPSPDLPSSFSLTVGSDCHLFPSRVHRSAGPLPGWRATWRHLRRLEDRQSRCATGFLDL